MSNTAPLAGDPPQEAPTDLPGGVQAPETSSKPQTPEEWDNALDDLDGDALAAILTPGQAPESAPEKEKPEPEVIEAPEPEIEPEPEPVATPAPAPALDTPGAPPTRIRLNGLPPDQQTKVADYVKAIREGKSPEEAAAILAPPAPTPSAPAAETPAKVEAPARVEPPEPSQAIGGIDARIATTREKLKTAREGYDAVAISELTEQLTDLKIERADVVRRENLAEAARAHYTTQFESHVANLRAAHPELDDENSAMSIRLEELRDLESVRNPGFDRDPAFILKLAARAAQDTQGKAAAVPAPEIPQPQPRTRPVGAVPPGSPPVSKTMTKEEAERDFDQHMAGMSEEEQAAFLADILPYPANAR
jgi:hypothetical protein